MALELEISAKVSIKLIDKIIGVFEVFFTLLIPIIFVSIAFSLFAGWELHIEKSLDTYLSMVFVIGMLSIIPVGLFSFLTQVFRIIRRKNRPITFFNLLMLVISVATILLGTIAFMGIYAVVG